MNSSERNVPASLRGQVDEIKRRLSEKQVKSEEYKKSVKDYLSKVSDGYVTSINVIIDVSSLLAAYKKLLDDLLKVVGEANFASEGLGDLSEETTRKLAQLDNFFKEQFQKLTQLVKETTSDGETRNAYMKNLTNIQQLYSESLEKGKLLGQKGGKKLVKIVPKKRVTVRAPKSKQSRKDFERTYA